MKYPELPERLPSANILNSPVNSSGRPIIWDEDGVPLNSDILDDGLRPNRDVRDYFEAPDLVAWPESIGARWSNTGLMQRVRPALPDMLATTIETANGLREVFGNDGEFDYSEGLIIIEGLQKAWSLLMYGPNRIENGALPRHFAGLQRTLKGHQGVVLKMAFDSPLHLLSGDMNDGAINADEFADGVLNSETDALLNSGSNEYCPASKAAHIAMIDCLFLPKDEAVAKHQAAWLDRADPNKSLSNYGLTPTSLAALGLEFSNVLLHPGRGNAHENFLLTHRFLAGERTPEVEAYMLGQVFESEPS